MYYTDVVAAQHRETGTTQSASLQLVGTSRGEYPL